jgi:hypothetical protein
MIVFRKWAKKLDFKLIKPAWLKDAKYTRLQRGTNCNENY